MNAPPPSRNPWPIAITAFFVLFFAGLVLLVGFASRQHVDLVRADYYEEEIRFQQQLDRVERTRALDEAPAIAYDASQKSITICMPSSQLAQTGGRIHLYRPSDARLDRDVALAIDTEGGQRLDARGLRAGLWKVRLQWTLGGQEYFYDRSLVVPKPAA